MFSIYCSAFNLNSSGLDWKSAIFNFSAFADEVIICVNNDNENSFDIMSDHVKEKKYENVFLVNSDFSFDDPFFDGKIKNFALKHCTKEFSILLDLDERIPLNQKNKWTNLVNSFRNTNYKGALIPSINLCGSIKAYKDIGYKWYLHKTEGCYRGSVNFAKLNNNKIDINKSDTCELIDSDGNLIQSFVLSNDINMIKYYKIPYVFHLWAVDFEQRIKQNSFWKPVWENRSGYEVNNIPLDIEQLKKIPVFEHELELW